MAWSQEVLGGAFLVKGGIRFLVKRTEDLVDAVHDTLQYKKNSF